MDPNRANIDGCTAFIFLFFVVARRCLASCCLWLNIKIKTRIRCALRWMEKREEETTRWDISTPPIVFPKPSCYGGVYFLVLYQVPYNRNIINFIFLISICHAGRNFKGRWGNPNPYLRNVRKGPPGETCERLLMMKPSCNSKWGIEAPSWLS